MEATVDRGEKTARSSLATARGQKEITSVRNVASYGGIMNSTGWTRRRMLLGTTAWVAAKTVQAANVPTRKAAIIGHTRAGDYGHGMQRIEFPLAKRSHPLIAS
ncbi:MAG: hypothetical protein HY736_13580 [Verrucomicrobia bacterium]|nr:hypothetical protein [Verrucomicrobiota bacterium]